MNPVIISLKRKIIEHLYAFYNFSDETLAILPCFANWQQCSPRLQAFVLCRVLVILHNPVHHWKLSPISLPLQSPWRTSTFAFITLHCNCLFTHLFPQLDSEFPEVGNCVLFNCAASCWLQGSPEPERWPTPSKYVTLQGSFPASALAPFSPPQVLSVLSTSCYLASGFISF